MVDSIRHLIFDMGGVLVKLQWHQQVSRLLGQAVPFEEVHALWGQSQAVHEHETGRLDFEAFTDAFIEEFGLDPDRAAFQAAFRAMLDADFDDTLPLLRELKGRYTLSLLSNTNPCHWAMVQARDSFLPLLDHPFTSLDFGLMKPDPAIYRRLLEALDARPGQCLFFDDGAHNVTAARELGLHADQVFGPEDIRRVLAARGLL